MSLNKQYQRDQVVSIINTVLQKIDAPAPANAGIESDIKDLAEIIRKTRAELAQARPADISQKFIPTATDELDEVVEETAKATDTIMDTCDTLNAMELPEPYKTLVFEEVTKIYEACSFQDITGQRIRKVVRTLKDIELKIASIMEAIGAHEGEASGDTRTGDAVLLNGPQLQGQGVSQDDIDKLLASFD